jgi:hypothetical protein
MGVSIVPEFVLAGERTSHNAFAEPFPSLAEKDQKFRLQCVISKDDTKLS